MIAVDGHHFVEQNYLLWRFRRLLVTRVPKIKKRVFDLIISVPALLLLLPIMGVIALLIRLKLGSPILFKQERPGLHGKPFSVYKFRTMTDALDEDGCLLADADRLTPFGQMLRKYSLDELVQLINVVKGDLSIVGPRPLLIEYMGLYTEEQARRHLVKPGITGWAQVNGRNAISWEERFQLDTWYVDHHSLALDLRILLLTVWRVVRPAGINHSNHATMPLFEGSSLKNESQ
ncbi:MAG: sugar transferase [Gorillibacterium sp.]|nr:sugar transferase [Gorillibacterium sp.]